MKNNKNTDEEIILLGSLGKCDPNYEINDIGAPQCDKCLAVITWVDLKKQVKRGLLLEEEYERLRIIASKAKLKHKNGLMLKYKVYFHPESGKLYKRGFYYEKDNE
jgi:hypothetical protein